MRRRNPDDEIRAAERKYFQTADDADKLALVTLQRRTGMTCQKEEQHPGSRLVIEDLCDYCHAYVCVLCAKEHNQPLPSDFSNQCVYCEKVFSDENPCYNDNGNKEHCFKHYHREGYCQPCWEIRENEIQHEYETDADPQYMLDDYDHGDYDY